MKLNLLKNNCSYNELRGQFRWSLPEKFNMGSVLQSHPKDTPAIIYIDERNNIQNATFSNLEIMSNKLANALLTIGIKPGDRLGILLSQGIEAAVSHLACYKSGIIAIPLFVQFGTDALAYRLKDSEATCVIVDVSNIEKVMDIVKDIKNLKYVIVVSEKKINFCYNFFDLINESSESFHIDVCDINKPAVIIYTSGTTAEPKGAVHSHTILFGHLPCIEFTHNFFPQKGDLFWTPADWAWIGGLFDALMPCLYYGVPIIAHRMKKFDPEKAFYLIEKLNIRNVFLPPTALKMMREVDRPSEKYKYSLRSVASGGESLGYELLEWGKREFSLYINEFYGQTECNLIIGNSYNILPIKPGSMGVPIPGHSVELIDEKGEVLDSNEVGEIAVKKGDPSMFIEYFKKPDATKEKFIGDFLRTGDLAKKDDDGYFYFQGRNDDIINCSGYRISPVEIENTLMKHPYVKMAAVVGVPDNIRGEKIKAFIILKENVKVSDRLELELQSFVKNKLAAYEYPREIAFVDSLPQTATGKIRRSALKKL
jgi:acetyl-CoA synthetase